MRFFLIGFMGCGKSYWAKQWSEAFGLKCYDLDQEIETRENKTIASIFKENGEDAFRKIERQTLQTYFHLDHYIMSCGGGTPCFFDNLKQMNEKGVTIFLNSTVEELVARLKNEKEARPLLKDVADDVLDVFIREKLKQREHCYSGSMYHLHTKYLSNENFERILRLHEK
jgi:shikimate kinase